MNVFFCISKTFLFLSLISAENPFQEGAELTKTFWELTNFRKTTENVRKILFKILLGISYLAGFFNLLFLLTLQFAQHRFCQIE